MATGLGGPFRHYDLTGTSGTTCPSDYTLEVGDEVEFQSDPWPWSIARGVVGEVQKGEQHHRDSDRAFIWHSHERYAGGSRGLVPIPYPYNYSWAIPLDSSGFNMYKVRLIKKANKNNDMAEGLVSKFSMLFVKEPQKSFRIAGITDSADLLTNEGTKVFLTWLLQNKFADEFKTAVVDQIVAEMEKEKK